MSTETLNPPQAEQEAKKERLSKEEFDKAFADIAFILALESILDDDDPIWDEIAKHIDAPEKKLPDVPTYESAAADVFSMLNYALKPVKINLDGMYLGGDKRKKERPSMSYGSFATAYQTPSYAHDYFANDMNTFTNHAYGSFPAAAPAAQKSDFTPAPSMAAEPLGPQLPDLSFNDRIRPADRNPTEASFASADRANEMYRRALFDKGWRGGEATPDQAKKAGRAMQRQYHPDVGASQPDIDAITAYNSHNARPTTPGKKGPEPSAPAAPAESAGPGSTAA